MRTNEEKQLATRALDAPASAIERGESDPLKAYLATLARSHRYSIGNILLIGSCCGKPSDEPNVAARVPLAGILDKRGRLSLRERGFPQQ